MVLSYKEYSMTLGLSTIKVVSMPAESIVFSIKPNRWMASKHAKTCNHAWPQKRFHFWLTNTFRSMVLRKLECGLNLLSKKIRNSCTVRRAKQRCICDIGTLISFFSFGSWREREREANDQMGPKKEKGTNKGRSDTLERAREKKGREGDFELELMDVSAINLF